MTLSNIIRTYACCVLMLFFFGCVSVPSTAKLPTEKPGNVTATRQFGYTADELLQAAKEAMIRTGLSVEQVDQGARRVTSSGFLTAPNGQAFQAAMAAFVTPINDDPRSQIDIVVIWGDMFLMRSEKEGHLRVYFAELQKVLLTY